MTTETPRVLSSPHTHTRYCDGLNTVQEMLRRSRELGFVSLGFSGHGDQGFDYDYSMTPEKQAAYVRDVREAQRACAEAKARGEAAPRVWLGVELDARAPRPESGLFDYVIGSTHYLPDFWRGRAVPVDGELPILRDCVAERFAGDALAMAETYFQTHADSICAAKPDIIGHFDIVRKHAGALFDVESARYRAAASHALARVRETDAVLEINTGGMARGYLREPYPSDFLLSQWREMGGRVVVSSDCHDARLLDFGLDDAAKRLARLGFRSFVRLGAGDALWDEIGL